MEQQDRQAERKIRMKDLWNGMFDFNGDGQMDIGEEYLAYKIYEAVTEESEDSADEDEELWPE